MIKEPELVKVLVVEADPFHARGLSASLQQYGYAVAGIAGQAEEAGRLLKETDVDIILINTHIPGDKDGIDIVFELMKIKRVPVIYLVACGPQDAIAEINSLVPAVTKSNGHDTVEVENEIILRQGSYIFIKRNFHFIKISLSEILYMEADGNYVHIIIKEKKFTIRLSLMQVIRKINYSRFARINRSTVVNMDAIQSFNKEQVVIAQYEISIGKNYKESFFRELGFR